MRLPLSLLILLCAACASGRRELRAAEAKPATPAALRLTLVTFNVHDLFVADRRRDRMRAIGRELGKLRPDVIALQEAFHAGNRAELEAELERVAGTDYESLYFPSGTMGSGLCLLTRHAIEKAVYWRYSKNGAWYQVRHGDWFAGKGAAMTRIRIGETASVDVVNTHCIANYLEADYREDRTVQIEELAKFLETETTPSAPVFLLGDLNATRASPEFEPLAATEDLVLSMTPAERSRIDHVLVRPHPEFEVRTLAFRELWSGVDDDGESIGLSDHAGLVVTVSVERKETP